MKRRKRRDDSAKIDPGYVQAITIRMARYDVDLKTARTQEIGHGLGRLMLAMERAGKIDRFHASVMLGVASQAEEVIRNFHLHVIGSPSSTPRVDHGRHDEEDLPDVILSGMRGDYEMLKRSVRDRRHWMVLERYCLGDNELEGWRITDIRMLLVALEDARGS